MTGKSYFMLIFVLHKATLPNRINSVHRKKKVREFPVPSRDVKTKLSLGGINDVITELYLPRGSLVSDIPAGDGKLVNLFLRCTMNERCHTNSVQWMYAIGLNKSGFTESTNCVHSWYRVSVTAFIHGTELMWPRSFMVLSWCDPEHSWYGVGVIPQSHFTWFLCTLYSGNSFGGFFPFCLPSMTSAAINLLCVYVTIRINRVFHSQHFFQQINNFWKYNVKKSTKFHT